MDRVLKWWNTRGSYRGERECSGEKRYVILVKSLMLAALPLLCCLVYCAGEGRSLAEVYAPSSEWNDELFYFKQVESILNFGYPQGYFGFNESHALKLSFAAWSPILVFPWLIWGLVFGWNIMSPIYCNIFLVCFVCFLFVWLVRPAWKQMGVLALLFCLYKPFVRYMFSAMAEVICFVVLIFFYSLSINYLRREKDYKLAVLFLVSGLMALMRPYLVLFMLLPIYLWSRRGKSRAAKWRNGVAGMAVLAAVLGIYVCINHYLGAEYFTPLFFTDWISAFFEEGLFGGIYFTLRKLYYAGQNVLRIIGEGFRDGLASGAHFMGYLVCMAVLTVQAVRDWWIFRRLSGSRTGSSESKTEPETAAEETKTKLIIEAHLAFCFVAMFFAILLMYKLTEGSRHLLTFMAAAIFVIALMDTKFYKKAVLVGVTFAYFYFYVPLSPFDYEIPFKQEERADSVEAWTEAMQERLVLNREDTPNYDNVVIWVFSDMVGDEEVRTSYQLLYGLPKGFGISCCMRDYVTANIDTLKSRYIAVPSYGEIARLCEARGCRLVYGDDELALYELHGGR